MLCWDFLSFVSIQLHLQKPCEGCQEVNFPPILTWLWNIWCFASLINCWLVHLHSSFQVYDMYFMKQSGVCPNFYKGKGAWPILSVTSCFWPLPITQYFHKYHTLGAFCHKTGRKTNIFMGDVRQRIICPDWHAALVVSEVCESSGGDKFSSVACPLTISSMNSISAFSWGLFRTETSFHSTEHVDKMQK